MVECIDCEGEGEYESPQPQAHGETSYTTHTCYTCDGTGEKPEEVTFSNTNKTNNTMKLMQLTQAHLENLVQANYQLKFDSADMQTVRMKYFGTDAISLANTIYFDFMVDKHTTECAEFLTGDVTTPQTKTEWRDAHMVNVNNIHQTESDLQLKVGDEIPVKFYESLLNEYPVLDDEVYFEVEAEFIETKWENYARLDVEHGLRSKLKSNISEDTLDEFVEDNIKELDYEGCVSNLKGKLELVNKYVDFEATATEGIDVEAIVESMTSYWENRRIITDKYDACGGL